MILGKRERERQARAEAAAASAAADRRAVFASLRPSGLPPAQVAEWAALADRLANDPPSWSASPRYVSLMREYCAEQVRLNGYDVQLATVSHEVYREPAGNGTVRAKVNPFVALRAASAKRLRLLEDALELSPRSARKAKVSQFDAA